MDTLNFLQRVLPEAGMYCSFISNADRKRQIFHSTVESLSQYVQERSKQNYDTYFAISTFNDDTKRSQANVQLTKVFALDVDCGPDKPFPSWKEGLVELGKFVKDMNLPKPMIVRSGNGLHVYWVLTQAIKPSQWQPVADAIKAAAQLREFKIDMSVPADSARILRPVGTVNTKGGNTVTLLLDAQPVEYETIAERVLGKAPTAQAIPPRPSGFGSGKSALAQSLAVTSDIPPGNPVLVESKCQQIHWAVRNKTEVSEPMWYSLLGVAAYCTEPEQTAIQWSEGHPDFNANTTIRKLNQWRDSTTGPATCQKFEAERPEGCKNCKYRGKIGTPARLGVQYKEIQAPADAPDTVVQQVRIPRPFKRTADGIKMTLDSADVDVCKFDIYPVAYGRDESLGYEVVRYHWNRPHMGWQELVMRQAYLTEGHREFATALADQGIVLNSKAQTGYFQMMLRTYMDELRQVRAMTNLHNSMGWKENFTQFLLGDTLLRRNTDGSVSKETVNMSSTTQRLGSELFKTAGDLKEWVQFSSVIERTGLPAHAFALMVGFSGPLYALTGLKGMTVSLYGPTGTGKSIAQLWMQSIFGDPDKLHYAAKFTQNALFSRMGLYCHLPMSVDETTLMSGTVDVGDFLYWVSQGRDKARLSRQAEEREAKSWSCPMVVSTNKSMNSQLMATGLAADAQMARLLEVTVPPNPLFTTTSYGGRKIHGFITTNYGLVGEAFVTKLLELGEDGLRATIAQATESFHTRYNAKFAGHERYWEQVIILADVAGQLAHQWGLIKFDPVKGIEWVLAQLGAIRRTVQENKQDSFDILSEYLNEHADSTVTVMHTGTAAPTVDFNRIPRSEIRVRYDLYRKASGEPFDKGTVLFDRTHFRRWAATKNTDYRQFINDLTEEHALATPKSNKAYLAKDTPVKLPQSYVVGVNLNHARLRGILNDLDQAIEDAALGKLRSV